MAAIVAVVGGGLRRLAAVGGGWRRLAVVDGGWRWLAVAHYEVPRPIMNLTISEAVELLKGNRIRHHTRHRA